MPRRPRPAPGGYVSHALNRGTARLTLFRTPADSDACLRVLKEALPRYPTRFLAYGLMPTPWHFVLWPERDGPLSQLRRWLTLTPSVRWPAHSHRTGSGPVYQNRFKAFPIEQDEHLSAVRRYLERNPLRAGLVSRAEEGRGSSPADRVAGGAATRWLPPWLPPWPVPVPEGWVRWVKEPQREAELEALRIAVGRGRPYGAEGWRRWCSGGGCRRRCGRGGGPPNGAPTTT